MPISTSVITGTVAHKHSASGGSGDGGKLATGGLGGDTSFDLANGSLMFSNGTSLDELVIGGAGTVLTEAGGVPTWAGVGGSNWEFLGASSVTAGTSVNVTFAEVQPPDYCLGIFEGTVTAGQGNDVEISGDTNSNYSQLGSYQIGTSETLLSTLNQVRWSGCLSSIAGSGFTVRIELHTNAQTSETHAFIAGFSDMQGMSSIRGKNTTASTGVTAIRFFGASNFTGTLNVWACRN